MLNNFNQIKKNIFNSFIQKADQPKEGEERQYKDGLYKFIEGHWKKQNNETPQKEENRFEGKNLENKLKEIEIGKIYNMKGIKVRVENKDEEYPDVVEIKLEEDYNFTDKDKLPQTMRKGSKFRVSIFALEKIKEDKSELKEGEVKIFDRPEMENPVYVVRAGGKDFFIQREQTNDYDVWIEVKKKDPYWEKVGDENSFLGFTKKEAIDNLMKQFGGKNG